MEVKKLVRISDGQSKMLDFIKKELDISENAIFKLALIKLYKELKNG
jgi:hypothetical protein